MYTLRALGLSFGNSFADLASPEQAHPRISVELSWDESLIGVTMQQVSSPDAQTRVVAVGLRVGGVDYNIELAGLPVGIGSAIDLHLPEQVALKLRSAQDDLRAIATSMLHIPSARPQIDDVYSMREPQGWLTTEVPYLLAADRSLAADVANWMDDALQVGSVAVDSAAFAFRLTARERQTTINLASAGRGTQAALPVATLLMAIATERLKCSAVVVEEPEAHLHPSAHGALADLIVKASANAQIIIETHSENLILRLRRHVAEKTFSSTNLMLHYVDADHLLSQIEIDEFGGAPAWPSGVFESDILEAQAIMEAKLQAISRQG